MSHQLFTVFPYCVNRYILRKEVILDDLYQDKLWDHGAEIGLQIISRASEDKGWDPTCRTKTAEQDSIALAPDQTNDGVVGGRKGSRNISQGHDARSISSSVGTFD